MSITELTKNEIVEKEFKTKIRGYDNDEVDEYLDIVIRDYKAFEDKIYSLKQENERLINRLNELSSEQTSQSNEEQPTKLSTSNFDILKRISNLERHVFGSKLSDNE